MPSLFLALLVTALTTLGVRDAVTVSRLSAGLGGGVPLLAACWIAAATGMALAAWVGAGVAEYLGPDARAMLVAFALLGGLELLFQKDRPRPAEPTRSFGAVVLVLAAGQLTGAAGFMTFALAGQGGLPWLVAIGGALGAGGVLSAAWATGEGWERLPLRGIRITVAGLLLVAAIITGLSARGLIG